MRIRLLPFTIAIIILIFTAFVPKKETTLEYFADEKYLDLHHSLVSLSESIIENDLTNSVSQKIILKKIHESRLKLKSVDFLLRYLEPNQYKRINGPLPIEWETEVFEKFEMPYKREGFGLTLAELAINEGVTNKDSLVHLINQAQLGINYFKREGLRSILRNPNTFILANRLFLLNLSAIYTTGFECPDTQQILPELLEMLKSQKEFYGVYNNQFSDKKIPDTYLNLFDKTIDFVGANQDYEHFNHFIFIRDFVNPLFTINQQLILLYKVRSENFNDYSLSKESTSIFDKKLYTGQNTKGVYGFVEDKKQIAEIKQIGKLLFYDPILSANNKRSCASCHKPTQFFTDTTISTSPHFDQKHSLLRNTPSLLNVIFNHLLMLDGKHTSTQQQAEAVMLNPTEMASNEKEILKKVLSCQPYKQAFTKFLKYTPQYDDVTMQHLSSAITLYYKDFSLNSSPFDDAMNKKRLLNDVAVKGFNLFMGKAQCGTCHFVPQFNGVKPPYISSEFEVIGVPDAGDFTQLSKDFGRFGVNPVKEMKNAFRTTTIRNSARTKPYMHNGIFKTLDEVIDFYDNGGGTGRKISVSNQTLSSDSLHLTSNEKKAIKAFIFTLNETIKSSKAPTHLPFSQIKVLNKRKIGGEY